MEWLKARLVDDWRNAWRWWSVRWNALGTVLLPLLTAVPAMPAEVQAMLPLKARALAAGLYMLVGIAFRVTQQKRRPDAAR